METHERWLRAPMGGSSPAGRTGRWSERPGWIRCQVMGRPAQLWTRPARDTEAPVEPTSPVEAQSMLKKAKNRASAILTSSAELYREMALSALRLVRR